MKPREVEESQKLRRAEVAGRLPYAFAYETTDIPAGMTIREYRVARAARDRQARRARWTAQPR